MGYADTPPRTTNFELPDEHACVFGDTNTLTGVYTPDATQSETGRESPPCALYLTAGLLHHIGPSRLHVEMARALSMRGVAGFRFDLSGVGDSETGSLGGYFMERSVQEVMQCMNFLQTTYGHKRFILFGLCSGADDALATALQDRRVVGVALLNGYSYKAGWFKLHKVMAFYLPRLMSVSKVRNRLRGLTARISSRFAPEAEDANASSRPRAALDPDATDSMVSLLKSDLKVASGDVVSAEDQAALNALDDNYRYVPPQELMADNLNQLLGQNTDMLFVFTGSEYETYTYQGQLMAMFPTLKNSSLVTEKYIRQSDHAVILEEDRRLVIETVSDWLNVARFGRESSKG